MNLVRNHTCVVPVKAVSTLLAGASLVGAMSDGKLQAAENSRSNSEKSKVALSGNIFSRAASTYAPPYGVVLAPGPAFQSGVSLSLDSGLKALPVVGASYWSTYGVERGGIDELDLGVSLSKSLRIDSKQKVSLGAGVDLWQYPNSLFTKSDKHGSVSFTYTYNRSSVQLAVDHIARHTPGHGGTYSSLTVAHEIPIKALSGRDVQTTVKAYLREINDHDFFNKHGPANLQAGAALNVNWRKFSFSSDIRQVRAFEHFSRPLTTEAGVSIGYKF